jgi:hypothetical protein
MERASVLVGMQGCIAREHTSTVVRKYVCMHELAQVHVLACIFKFLSGELDELRCIGCFVCFSNKIQYCNRPS